MQNFYEISFANGFGKIEFNNSHEKNSYSFEMFEICEIKLNKIFEKTNLKFLFVLLDDSARV